MSEDYTENGRVSDGEASPQLVPTPDINSPRHSVTTPPVGVATTAAAATNGEASIEFFGQKGGGVSESGSEGEGESSPRTPQDKDNTSFHSRPYVTVSVSPGERGVAGRGWYNSEWGGNTWVEPIPHISGPALYVHAL